MNNKLHRFTLLGSLVFALAANATDIKNLQAGTLKDCQISPEETALTISGQMDASDFFYIFDNLNALEELNISAVQIIPYNGQPLNYTSLSTSEANAIPDYALTGLVNLKSIVLPTSLQKIGRGAFSGSGITSIEIPQGVTIVGDYAFMRCNELTSIQIPTSVSTLGTRAFAYCSKLEEVQMLADIQTIPEGLFEACGGIKELYFDGLAQCTEIGQWALAECNGIETLVLPFNAQIIEKAALYGTTKIQTLELPENLNFIDNNAMTGMTELNTLNVSNVQYIPELGENVWGRMDKSAVTLITPNDLVSEYKNTEQWQEFNVVSLDEWRDITHNITVIGNSSLTIAVQNGKLVISSGKDNLNLVSIYNIAGTRITYANAGQKVEFNVENWPRGVYLVVTGIGAAKISI